MIAPSDMERLYMQCIYYGLETRHIYNYEFRYGSGFDYRPIPINPPVLPLDSRAGTPGSASSFEPALRPAEIQGHNPLPLGFGREEGRIWS